MAQVFDKRLNSLRKDLQIWEMEKNIWEMAYIHGSRLKYLRNGLTMLEMA